MNRSLALFALLALAFSPARGADDAPPFVVLVVKQTVRGVRDEILATLGIPRSHDWSTLKKLERDLQRIIDRKELYGSFLAPTVCFGASIDDACPAVRMIPDVQLPEAIAALKPSRIKSRTKEFARWANPCVKASEHFLTVRQYGLRMWIYSTSHRGTDAISLMSLPWGGCNNFDVL